MDKKIFRPTSAPFIVISILVNLLLIGLVYLIIHSILESNILYLIIGVLGTGFLLFEDIKVLTWNVTLYDDHIYVPSSVFDHYIFGKKRIQKIFYSDIEKMDLQVRPVQILVIERRNRREPNIIYVKQFSKKQVYDMMAEIDLRVKPDTSP